MEIPVLAACDDTARSRNSFDYRRPRGRIRSERRSSALVKEYGYRARRREASALRAFAETTHPNGAAASDDPDWRKLANAFVSAAGKLDDARYPVEALRLLSWFRDGHTTLNVADLSGPIWKLRLPISRDVFFDGLYVTAAKDEALSLLGAKVTHIGGIQIETLIRRFAAIWPAAGVAYAHRWSLLLLSSPGFLHAFGRPMDRQMHLFASMAAYLAARRLMPNYSRE